MNDFEKTIACYQEEGLYARNVEILQVNVGLLCNQVCNFCLLKCGPNRTEVMSWPTMELLLEAAADIRPRIVDITGGAPELNPHIRDLVMALRSDKHRIQLRTNLTALMEPGMNDLPEFLHDHKVKLVASLPCFTEDNIMCQEKEVVYKKSILALKLLNDAGYSVNPDLYLDLVYNPGGTALPNEHYEREQAYRRELYEHLNITFSRLLSITNMPVGRYRTLLRWEGRDVQYVQLLVKAFNPRTLNHLLCRHQVSIGFDGAIYDCDINLALGLPVDHGRRGSLDTADMGSLAGRRIITGVHCYSCTAGYVSSCGGSPLGEA